MSIVVFLQVLVSIALCLPISYHGPRPAYANPQLPARDRRTYSLAWAAARHREHEAGALPEGEPPLFRCRDH
jgi:hypothetical protein